MRLLLFSALEGHELSEMFFESTMREIRGYIRRYIRQRIADGAFREIVLFTPPGAPGVIAVEPYTHTTDAINLAAKKVRSGWDRSVARRAA